MNKYAYDKEKDEKLDKMLEKHDIDLWPGNKKEKIMPKGSTIQERLKVIQEENDG